MVHTSNKVLGLDQGRVVSHGRAFDARSEAMSIHKISHIGLVTIAVTIKQPTIMYISHEHNKWHNKNADYTTRMLKVQRVYGCGR